MQKMMAHSLVRKIPWRRAWQATSVFVPGESHGQRSLAGYSPQSHRVRHNRSDLAHTHSNSIPEIMGSPKPCVSCEFPGCWRYTVAWSPERLLFGKLFYFRVFLLCCTYSFFLYHVGSNSEHNSCSSLPNNPLTQGKCGRCYWSLGGVERCYHSCKQLQMDRWPSLSFQVPKPFLQLELQSLAMWVSFLPLSSWPHPFSFTFCFGPLRRNIKVL